MLLREGKPLVARTSANQEWALDFVHDAVECGRAIRVLSVMDAYTRECLALEVDTIFASRRVTRVLDAIRRGQYSIRVNDQWRMCFEWREGASGPSNVEIVDYH